MTNPAGKIESQNEDSLPTEGLCPLPNEPCACFNALPLSSWNSPSFLTRGPIFSFHTGPCKLCSWSCLSRSSASSCLQNLRRWTNPHLADWVTGFCPSTVGYSLRPLSLAAQEDKNSVPCQQAASGTFCDEQHPFLLAYSCTHKLNKYNGNDMCKPRISTDSRFS